MKKTKEKLATYLKRLGEIISGKFTVDEYFECEYLAERFVCALRDMSPSICAYSREEVMSNVAMYMGITVRKTGEVIEIKLPVILPQKAKTKANYLFEPLFYAMSEAAKKYNFFVNERVMMCIEYICDDRVNTARCDHDNKEVKQVIDAISTFVVPDDNDCYLSLCQITTTGNDNCTKVYVMPERCFGSFFDDHCKALNNGVKSMSEN